MLRSAKGNQPSGDEGDDKGREKKFVLAGELTVMRGRSYRLLFEVCKCIIFLVIKTIINNAKPGLGGGGDVENLGRRMNT